jgi:uncharacterized protein (TIGR03435 family)
MTWRMLPSGKSHRCRTRIILITGIAAVILPSPAQTGKPVAPETAATPQSYEVVSIRQNNSGKNSNSDRINGGVFSAENFTLSQLVFDAYLRLSASDHGIIMRDQVVGLPGWADADRFNVEARTDADTAAAMQGLPGQELFRLHQPMLRAALADRFKLTAHFEQRERPVYELVLAKGGSKLKASTTDQNDALRRSNGKLEGWSYPIDWLAFNLSGDAGRLVVNKTGLTGKYDFTLTWTPDEQQGTLDAGPTLFTALEEQLGLKLVPAKSPVDILVIDHVERPSEN